MNQCVIVTPRVFPSLWVIYQPHEPVFVLEMQLRVLAHLFGSCGSVGPFSSIEKVVDFVKPLHVLGVDPGVAGLVNIFPINSHGNLIRPLSHKSWAIFEVLSLQSFDVDQTKNRQLEHSSVRRLPHAKRALYSGVNPAEGRVSRF
jgi:hypothetical protein